MDDCFERYRPFTESQVGCPLRLIFTGRPNVADHMTDRERLLRR